MPESENKSLNSEGPRIPKFGKKPGVNIEPAIGKSYRMRGDLDPQPNVRGLALSSQKIKSEVSSKLPVANEAHKFLEERDPNKSSTLSIWIKNSHQLKLKKAAIELLKENGFREEDITSSLIAKARVRIVETLIEEYL